MKRFLWSCIFLALVLAMIAAAGGLLIGCIPLAVTFGNPWFLLGIPIGIPLTVALALGAHAALDAARWA